MPSESHFKDAIFRYRSIDALLGRRSELERQTIYFAPPEYLNDPIEGTRQIYWRGGRITWRNFLRHYIICLQSRIVEAMLTPDTERLSPHSISVFQRLDNAHTPMLRELLEECIREVELSEIHAQILNFLTECNRDVGLSEVKQYLRIAHLDWFVAVHDVLCRHGLAHKTEDATVPKSNVDVLRRLQSSMKLLHETHTNAGVEIASSIQDIMAEQISLLATYQNTYELSQKYESLLFEFTSEYLGALSRLIYPQWYVACFSARHDSAAMWSYYADNHAGCCLVFSSQQTDIGPALRLKGPNGYGSDGLIHSTMNLPLQAVNYSRDEQRIEFFNTLGQLPHATLMREWFQDDAGATSPLADHLCSEKNVAWRKSYWDKFAVSLLRKLPDWEHEQEYRIVLPDIIDIHSTDEGRTFKYDYNTLGGIIFGINTTLSNKIKIMRIIDKKLGEHRAERNFKFFQARYNPQSGRIEAHHLSIIRHKKI